MLADYPHAQISRAYAHVSDFRYQPDPFGSLAAREAIASEYRKRGIIVPVERIALTASTSEAYGFLFKLWCNPGDEILAPTPSYPLFEFLANLECVRVVPYRLGYDGSWYVDFSHLRSQITSNARALVIVNPNNPTGSFLKAKERAQLAEIAMEYSLPVISDEVFMDYELTGDEFSKTFIGCGDVLSLCLNGLSKMAGMPQVKLGWIVLSGQENLVEAARVRLELLLDTYLSVNTPTQCALSDLFEVGDQIRAKLRMQIRQNHDFLRKELDGTGIHVLRTEGGWSAILQLSRIVSEEIWVQQLLNEHDTIVQPGYFFDMPSEACILVSLITDSRIFEEGIRRLRLLLAGA